MNFLNSEGLSRVQTHIQTALDMKADKLLVEKQFTDSVADWNQNDEFAPDYVKNRTHYSNGIKFKFILKDFIIAENNWQPDDGFFYFGLNVPELFNNQTCLMTWDDAEYNCEWVEYEGKWYLGNISIVRGLAPDTGEPFVYQDSGIMCVEEENVKDTTISIQIPFEDIKTIDPKFIKDMYYEIPVIIEEQTSTGITDAYGWVKIADTLDFNINDVETFSCRTNKKFICQGCRVQPIEEEDQTILIVPNTENTLAIYVTPEQAEINNYCDAGFHVWGGEEGEEIEATYSFTLKSITYKVDKKYLQNSNIINGSADGALEMRSDWEWNRASGKYSMAIGENSRALAEASFASGHETRVNEDAWCGHAEGRGVEVSGVYAHAENFYTEAIGESSHAEGVSSRAIGDQSHAEGWFSEAHGKASHSENNSRAFGDYSHSEGLNTFAGGEASHAEGKAVISSGYQSSISGEANTLNYITSKNNSNIVPGETVVTLYRNNGHTAHASAVVETYDKTTGALTLNRTLSEDEAVDGTAKFQIRGAAFGDYSHIEGYGTQALGQGAHAEGIVAEDLVGSIARGDGSHIEGVGTETGTDGYGAHAEGFLSKANGWASHAEGKSTHAEGDYSHAEGNGTTASGERSHAENTDTIASGPSSHAEGWKTISSGEGSHAEGGRSEAIGQYAHAEGQGSIADGPACHAEGYETLASQSYSHAEGCSTIANLSCQHVQGKYNIEDHTSAHIVGNGSFNTEIQSLIRSNAHTLDWEGNAWFAGDVYVGSTSGTNKDDGSKKLVTVDEMNAAIAAAIQEAFANIARAENTAF